MSIFNSVSTSESTNLLNDFQDGEHSPEINLDEIDTNEIELGDEKIAIALSDIYEDVSL